MCVCVCVCAEWWLRLRLALFLFHCWCCNSMTWCHLYSIAVCVCAGSYQLLLPTVYHATVCIRFEWNANVNARRLTVSLSFEYVNTYLIWNLLLSLPCSVLMFYVIYWAKINRFYVCCCQIALDARHQKKRILFLVLACKWRKKWSDLFFHFNLILTLKKVCAIVTEMRSFIMVQAIWHVEFLSSYYESII